MSTDWEKLDIEADEMLQEALGQAPEESTDTTEETVDEVDTEETADDQHERAAEETQGQGGDTDAEPDSEETEPDVADPTGGLTLENAAERIRNAQARMTRATQEAAELKRQVQSLQDETASLKRSREAASSTEAEKPKAPETPADIDDSDLAEAMKEFPEVAKPLVRLIKQQQAELGQLNATITDLKGNVDQTRSQLDEESKAQSLKTHNDAILQAHNDAFQLAESDDFQGWKDRQPPIVQRAITNGSAQDVIWALDQYKAAVGAVPDETTKRREAAKASATPPSRSARQPSGGTRHRFTRPQINAMSPEEFAANETEIDKALAAGLISQ